MSINTLRHPFCKKPAGLAGKHQTRRHAASLALLVLALALAAPAQAQSWPARPIKVIIGFPAGGVVDVMARAVTDRLTAELGQPIVIENRPGAGSNIAIGAVLSAPADGYTWLVSSNFLFINPAMDNSLKWKATDFTPVARYALSPSFVLVPASKPWKTLGDFVEAARRNPGMRFGDGGAGTTQSLAMQMLTSKTGIKMEAVNYKGAPPMVPDLAGDLLQMTIMPSTVAISAVQTGRIKALASTGAKRSPSFPNVPTMSEAGYPEATAVSWYGIHLAAGTPKEVVERITKAIEKVCNTTEVRARLFSAGGEEAFQATAPFSSFVDGESRRWLALLKTTQK